MDLGSFARTSPHPPPPTIPPAADVDVYLLQPTDVDVSASYVPTLTAVPLISVSHLNKIFIKNLVGLKVDIASS